MFAVQRLGRWRALAPFVVLAVVLRLVTSNFAASTVHAAGTNYYVDSVNGNDGNPGTSPSAPWRNLSMINNRSFGAGDVINLARGSSWTGGGGTSNALVINGGGAQGSPITVQPYGTGAAPIIRNPSGSNSRGVLVQASWVVVQGLLVREAREAAVFLPGGSNNNVIKNNELALAGAGVQVQSQYNLVTGNNIHDLTMVVNTSGGDDDYGATAVLLKASNNEVSYNRFTNCKASSLDYGQDGGGVELFGTVDNVSIHHNYSNNTKGYIEIGGGSARNTLVAYNVIVNPESAIGLHLSGGFASTVDNFRFFNNTVIGNGGYGLFYNDGNLSGSQLIVRNNIFYANNYGILMQGSTGFTHDHNLYYFTGSQPNLNYGMGTGERVVDPMFVNMGGGDYHLRSGSPAINAGATTLYNSDMGGSPVPAGGAVDIGAYEYGSTASPTQPPAPKATAAPTSPAPRPTPPPYQPAVATNMLKNGTFESGVTPWLLQLNSAASATLSQDCSTKVDGVCSAKVSISNPSGTAHFIQLRQDSVNLQAGRQYQVIFWAKASASRSISQVVQQQDSPNNLYANKVVTLSTSWQKYTYTFTASQSAAAFVGLNLGSGNPTVWIDAVSVAPAFMTYLPAVSRR